MRISDWSSDVCSSDLRAAEAVMRVGMAAPARGDQASGGIAACTGSIQRMTAELSPRLEDAQIRGGDAPPEERLQRKARDASSTGTAPAAVAQRVAARAGQGRPLDRQMRSFMETRFGRDLPAGRGRSAGHQSA